MNEISNSLVAADIAHSMHPYTNMRAHEEQGPMVIARGEGIRVFDDKGKEYIEGMAGLWSVAVGFSESRLKDAAMKQMELLPYYHTFAHKAHEPSIRLAEKLAEMTPGDLNHCFFTNSGSEANDTVVKMVWFMNNALGRPNKKKFLARNKGLSRHHHRLRLSDRPAGEPRRFRPARDPRHPPDHPASLALRQRGRG